MFFVDPEAFWKFWLWHFHFYPHSQQVTCVDRSIPFYCSEIPNLNSHEVFWCSCSHLGIPGTFMLSIILFASFLNWASTIAGDLSIPIIIFVSILWASFFPPSCQRWDDQHSTECTTIPTTPFLSSSRPLSLHKVFWGAFWQSTASFMNSESFSPQHALIPHLSTLSKLPLQSCSQFPSYAYISMNFLSPVPNMSNFFVSPSSFIPHCLHSASLIQKHKQQSIQGNDKTLRHPYKSWGARAFNHCFF